MGSGLGVGDERGVWEEGRAKGGSGCGGARRRDRSESSPTVVLVTANRDELIHLIEGMPDDQVDVLLADARRLSSSKPTRTWPPKFVGMIKDGPEDGSSPDYIDSVLARGFGSDSR